MKTNNTISVFRSPIVVNGTMIGRNITFQDVSEIRQLIDKTNLQNETLQEQNQSLIAIKDELLETNNKTVKRW